MKTFKTTMTAVALAALLALPVAAHAEESSRATVKELKGEARYLKSGQSDWQPLDVNTVLAEGDAVRTAVDSKVIFTLAGASKTAEITVRPESEFVFKKFRHEGSTKVENTLLDVHLGGVLVKAEKLVGESKFEVKTPTSIVGIRGTTFEVQVSKKK